MSEYIDWDNKDLVRPSEDFTSDPDFDIEDDDSPPYYPEDGLPESKAISEGLPSQEDTDWLLSVSKQYFWDKPINIPVEEYPLYRAIQIALVMSGANYLNRNSLNRCKKEAYSKDWVQRWEEFYEK